MAQHSPLQLRTRLAEPNTTVVTAAGDIDMSSAAPLRDALLAAVRHGNVVFDVESVLFCDSSALRTLVEANRAAHDQGVSFRVAGPSTAVARVLELSGALQVLEVRPDVAAALAP